MHFDFSFSVYKTKVQPNPHLLGQNAVASEINYLRLNEEVL
jgi:hypothetical protein